MSVEKNVTLAPFTTFGIGGPARCFVHARTVPEAVEAVAFARQEGLPLFVLGGGSNILIADEGFDGLVLKLEITGITRTDNTVTVGAGTSWDEFVAWTVAEDLAGLEALSGIPGTVGGAVVANVGAYGAECSNAFVRAEIIDLASPLKGGFSIDRAACAFSYHDSLFAREPERYLILNATFSLVPGAARVPSYQDNRFDVSSLARSEGGLPTLGSVRNAILAIRDQKGLLIKDDGSSYKSAGSFFHMPFVSEQEYERIRSVAASLDPEKEERLRPWAWRQADGRYKLAPGFLLEYTAFKKGHRAGPVGISPKHILSIINADGARASDVAKLAREMQSAVFDVFGIALEREVEYVGNVEASTNDQR